MNALATTITVLTFLSFIEVRADEPTSRPTTSTAPTFPIPKSQPPALPKEFAFVFSWGYGEADTMPGDPEKFEEMLVNLKSHGFNVVHCIYRDRRPAMFKKHGMKMMIDVLPWKPGALMDIRKDDQRDTVEKICRDMRDRDEVWGYNLWNERLDEIGSVSKADLYLRMLRTWDPTHPVWVGTYRRYYADRLATSPGCNAYYDYHWKRGLHWHFSDLQFFQALVAKRNSTIGMWEQIEDYNKNLYTFHTSVAYGTKTIMWFIGGSYDIKTRKWIPDHSLGKIGNEVKSMYGLIGEMGRPLAVYSTPTTRDAANKEKPEEEMNKAPNHTVPFPKDHWLQVKSGEVLAGFFQLPDKSDIVYIANHNAFAEQKVQITAGARSKDAQRWNREKGAWTPIENIENDSIKFDLPPAEGEVLHFPAPK